jgi:ornithine cyclodeaminase/alanine dehydrogenase-like protein (mu-crystallin family)
MAGWHGGYFATKVYATHPKHGAHFFVHLFDRETAAPLALLEGNALGQIRTGAASGLATDLLANPDAKTLAVIGSGFQAQTQVEAVRSVRPSIENILVWSRSLERRTAFAAANGGIACPSAEIAVRNADIVCTATYARTPVIDVEWIAPGCHINAMGSNHADRREIPSEAVHRADVIVADSVEACAAEAGDLILADVDWNQVIELRHLTQMWRPEAVSLFKSVGLGLEDCVAAGWVYEQWLKEQ